MKINAKTIIIILTIIVFTVGIYFGFVFYKQSQNTQNNNTITNTDPGRTPFQTRVSTTTVQDLQENNNISVENPQIKENEDRPKLIQLWKEPVSGFDFIKKDIDITPNATSTNSTSTIIQRIQNRVILRNQDFIYLWDRKTGHIYENLASTTELTKISNYTLPEVQEAFFGDSSSVLIRKLEENNEIINTFYINLVKEFSSSTIYDSNIKILNIDSDNIAFIPFIKKVFYFVKGTGYGKISSIDGTAEINAITTNLTEFLPQYVNKDLIALTTKPSAYFKGYLFTLNTNGTGRNNYILGEKYGFNTLFSPDGTKVIYNEIINNNLETFIYDLKSKSSTYLTQATLVEKCTWSSNSKNIFCAIPQKLIQSAYPESWYKDEISFQDNIWSINPETGEFKIVAALQDLNNTPIDVYKLKVSDNENYLIFQNKTDLTLWKYTIK